MYYHPGHRQYMKNWHTYVPHVLSNDTKAMWNHKPAVSMSNQYIRVTQVFTDIL